MRTIYLAILLLRFTNGLTLPSVGNFTGLRLSYAKSCERFSCIHRWIRGDQIDAELIELAEDRCSVNWSNSDNSTLSLYEQKKVDWKFLVGYYSYKSYFYCHNECGFLGPIRFFERFIELQIQVSNARADNHFCGKYSAKYCRWWAYMMRFRIYFSYFAIPAIIVANLLNLSILNQMLGSHPGPALYLHLAEVISDGIYNILINFQDGLLFFISLDRWRTTCAYYQYSSIFQLVDVVKRYLFILNQAYLTGIVADRLYALLKPFKYGSETISHMRKRGKRLILKIFLVCTFFYLPFLLYRNFFPIFLHLKSESLFWKNLLDPLDAGIVIFYTIISFGFIISQAICGVFVEKSYRKFLSSDGRQQQGSIEELKKRERDKQLLLAGTIGLNLIAGTVNSLFNLTNTKAFYTLLNMTGRPWWRNVIFVADLFLNFINGNGALLIHVILVKSYREAFASTRFGHMICGVRGPRPKLETN